jgi:hypothetical protein
MESGALFNTSVGCLGPFDDDPAAPASVWLKRSGEL